MIVALLGLVTAIASFYYETKEQRLLAGVLVQNIWLDYDDDEDIRKLGEYFKKNELKNREKAFTAKRNNLLIRLQYLYDNGHYQELLYQGTPYTRFDSHIRHLVKNARKKQNQKQIEIALKKVPQLMKASKYGEVNHLVGKLNIPELQKYVDKARRELEQNIAELRTLYVQGHYEEVIKRSAFSARFDCRIKRLVDDSKKAKIIKQISQLMEKGQYTKATKLANQFNYATLPAFQKIINKQRTKAKSLEEQKILARLQSLSPDQIEANLREYNTLVKLFPNEDKYQRKLEDYKKQLIELRRQPPVMITQTEYGERWPFTVPKGELECRLPGIVTFKVDDIIYAINGLAISRGFQSIDNIWRNESNKEGVAVKKVALGPIISKGLYLCNP